MAYGTALASFNVEEFGTERVQTLTGEEIAERVGELQRISQLRGRAAARPRLSRTRVRSGPHRPTPLQRRTMPAMGWTMLYLFVS